MGKNHGERERGEFHYNTMGFSGVLGFVDLNPPPHWKGLSIYTVVSILTRVQSSVLFDHLIIYLGGG